MPAAEAGQFRKLGERVRLEGPFLRYVSATFVDPQGFTFERDIVRHPGAVCVVALEDDNETLHMVRQYRGAIDKFVLELPAGKLDQPGEEPERAARRELIEEVGLDPERLEYLGGFYNSPGFTDEHTHCFLAEGLRPVPRESQGPEEANMALVRVALGQVAGLVASGELFDAKSLIAIHLAQQVLEQRAPRP